MRASEGEEQTLGHFLASFREAGRLDSQGGFTMAGRKAAGKLAQCLLPEPADWILKIIQAACRAEASELRISQTSKATHLEFHLPYALDIQAFERGLTLGASCSQAGLDELATALRVVGLGQNRSWVARLRTGETTHWVLVQAGEVSLETVSGQNGRKGITEALLGIAFPPGESGKVAGLVRFGAAIQNEYEAVAHRARACPIPLWLDGQRADTLQRAGTLSGEFENEAFLGVALGQEPGRSPIRAPRGLQQSQPSPVRDRLIDPRPFYQPDLEGEGSSLMRVSFHFQKEPHARHGGSYLFRPLPIASRVLLIRHGVVVGRRNLGITEPIAVDIYLDASQERTDLTGLIVEVDDGHVQRARAELKSLEPFLTGLVASLEAHRARPMPRDLALYGGVSGLALLLAPLPLKLVTFGFSAFKLHDAARQHRQVLKDCLNELALFRQRHCGHGQPWRGEHEQSAAG